MSRVLYIPTEDLVQFSHASRQSYAIYTDLLEHYSKFMNEASRWDSSGRTTTYTTVDSKGRVYTHEVHEEAPCGG